MGCGPGIATQSGPDRSRLNPVTPSLTPLQEEAILHVCLMAAFADGTNSESEREEIKKIADSVSATGIHPASLYQDVLLGRTDLASASAPLAGESAALLAYEMAVCVCDADGATTPSEREFLDRLRGCLGVEAPAAAKVDTETEALALAPVVATTEGESRSELQPTEAPKVDGMILNYSILNGALELLPESLATMAIIPMQMKMVYRVGKAHGVELDRGHIKEFAAAAGVGLTSQVLEGFARKLLGGVFGKKKGMVRKAADQLTSSAFSFASTYALGHVADKYYAGGRSMGTTDLKALFNSTASSAKEMHSRYLPQIQEKAAGLDLRSILAEVRSGSPPAI
jgi:uncharacterized protein (DUF697 family)/tellurite resistance protein